MPAGRHPGLVEVGHEDQEDGGLGDPGVPGGQFADLAPALGVLDDDYRDLLAVDRGRHGLGGPEDGVEVVGRDRLVCVFSDRPVVGQGADGFVHAILLWVGGRPYRTSW